MKRTLLICLMLLQSHANFGEDKHIMAIEKKVLSNGLTVLVKQDHTIPKVSMQLFYNVGSKDEKTGEKGIAHLIEHMIFKGTKQMLSESDIKVIVHMLSGDCNAFTSYDYTGYKFNMPSHHWREMLPIMADCMVNASFKDEHLNSEMKAVIQELKMLKDNHARQAAYDLLTTIFPDHPYHYPLIGYKQDLWSVSGKDLERFYKKHYHPNNATLVVVGDVDPEEVFALAEKNFGAIAACKEYKREEFYHNEDIAAKSVTLYRDVQQPIGMLAFVVPGSKAKIAHLTDISSIILGTGKSSRLYKKLVDQDKLVTSLSATCIGLFDHGLFLIMYAPKDINDIGTIEKTIIKTMQEIADHGLQPQELQTALNKAKMYEYNLLESNEMQAYLIGQYYLATGDPDYIFNYLDISKDSLNTEIQAFLKQYFRPSVMHTGLILPLHEQDKSQWLQLQEESDKQDKQILSARQRTTAIEQPRYAHKITLGQAEDFDFPKAQSLELSNGLKVLFYNNELTPKINLMLEFKAKHWFDPQDKQGLFTFVSRMMAEGTKNYTADQLAEELESRGMSLYVYPGGVSMAMLHDDLAKGLELLTEMLTQATFPQEKLEKVRAQLFSDLKQFWDNPSDFSAQLTSEIIYKDHPYSKNILGTFEAIESITRDDLVQFYTQYISPDGATLALVGDLKDLELKKILEQTIGTWTGNKVEDVVFPALQKTCSEELNFPINRDQVVLTFAGLSVDRSNSDYDKLLLFDQIFGGRGLHSKLMQLREQTGIFYAISGSTIAQAGKQPGMVIVRTLVSVDRCKEAEDAIKHLIDTVADTLTEQELAEAKNAVASSLIGIFSSNANVAEAFLFLQKYGFANDYFDHRAKNLSRVSLQEVKDAAKKHLNSKDMCVVRVGRVGNAK